MIVNRSRAMAFYSDIEMFMAARTAGWRNGARWHTIRFIGNINSLPARDSSCNRGLLMNIISAGTEDVFMRLQTLVMAEQGILDEPDGISPANFLPVDQSASSFS